MLWGKCVRVWWKRFVVDVVEMCVEGSVCEGGMCEVV